MRAQIELAIRHIPQVNHLSCHMGCAGWDEAVGHVGYEGVSQDRQLVTEMFTNERVMQVIKSRGIELISYANLVE